MSAILSTRESRTPRKLRTPQAGKVGRALKDHDEQGLDVHLFVRSTAKHGSKGAPFTYCGQVDFVEWEGEKPITVQWRLREELPARLRERFGVQQG